MQTIGERLEEARKKKGISIREAAEATKIRGDYLQKFESNHFDIGLTEIYTRGFLRTYATYLKLPADRIINDYAALGRGDVRPRQPSREVYGRMDITVASANNAELATPPAEPAPAPEPSPANRGPQRSRTGSSLPTGPDPAVVFRYVKIGGIAIIAILALWLLWAVLSSSRRSASGGGSNTTTVAPRGPVITLIASKPVRVRVSRANPDGTEGELVYAGALAGGETKAVARQSALIVEGTPPENLDLDINGYRLNLAQWLAQSGNRGNKAQVPGP